MSATYEAYAAAAACCGFYNAEAVGRLICLQ